GDRSLGVGPAQAGTCPNCTFELVTSAGSTGAIVIEGPIRAGTVNLFADGPGPIATNITGNCAVCGNAINLKSGTGDIGSSGAPIEVASADQGTLSHLTANTKGTVVLLSRENASLLGSSGGTFSLTSLGSLTIAGPLNTTSGGATLVAQSGPLTVQPNTVILVKAGDLIIQNLDTATGSISIGSGANIQTIVTGKIAGKVSIVIGPIPAVPVLGKKPDRVT